MSPQYHSASWSEYGGGKWQLLFVVGDTCLFDLGGRAREGRMDLGWDDQDLLIPPQNHLKKQAMSLLPGEDKPGHVSSRYNIKSLA